MHKTLPLGSRTAGASNARHGFPWASAGKSGPAAQVPGSAGVAPDVYSAVWPLAPVAKTRPSAIRIAGPISVLAEVDSTRSAVEGTDPALTQEFVDGRYFSAFGCPPTSAVITVPSRRRVQVSSELASDLSGPGVHLFATGS